MPSVKPLVIFLSFSMHLHSSKNTCANSFYLFYKPNQLLQLMGTYNKSLLLFFFFTMKICIAFTTIRLFFSFQVFFVVHRFAIKLSLHCIADFTPNVVVCCSNWFFFIKKDAYLVSLQLFICSVIFDAQCIID